MCWLLSLEIETVLGGTLECGSINGIHGQSVILYKYCMASNTATIQELFDSYGTVYSCLFMCEKCFCILC